MEIIIVNNFVALSLIIGLALQLTTVKVFEKKISKLFSIAIGIIFLLLVIDMIDYYLASKETLNNFRYISSILGYILRPTLLGIFISILVRRVENFYLIWIPIILETIVISTSPFTKLVFYFDANNNFYRGPFGYLPHIIASIYVIILLVILIKKHRIVDKGEILTAIYIFGVIFVAFILETVFKFHFILPAAIISSTTIYYLYLYIQVYKLDIMTGLPNRRSFYTDAKSLSSNNMAVLSLDVNNLKMINDTKGHAAGDFAIQTVSKIIKVMGGKEYRCYRTGGDEFMILGVDKTLEDAKEHIGLIKKELSTTQYTVSIGCAIYTPDDRFDEICVQADFEMYEDKKKYKKNR